jgi:hypothetical protein
MEEPARREIEAFAAHALPRIFAERLSTISEEIGARYLALDQHGAAFAFPTDHVGRFSAGAGLFREHDAATIITTKPQFGEANELSVGHETSFSAGGLCICSISGVSWPQRK